jgi:hypothetical protein
LGDLERRRWKYAFATCKLSVTWTPLWWVELGVVVNRQRIWTKLHLVVQCALIVKKSFSECTADNYCVNQVLLLFIIAFPFLTFPQAALSFSLLPPHPF